MKRFLSWIVLIVCYFVFCLVVHLDLRLLLYIIELYVQLSAMGKLLVILIGGTTILGITLAPLYYGIPLTYALSETICPSKRGTRYLIWGIIIIITTVFEALLAFMIRDILIGIYGIALVVYAWNHEK